MQRRSGRRECRMTRRMNVLVVSDQRLRPFGQLPAQARHCIGTVRETQHLELIKHLSRLKWTQKQIAAYLGKGRSVVRKRMALAGIRPGARGRRRTTSMPLLKQRRTCDSCGFRFEPKLRWRPDRPGPTPYAGQRYRFCSKACSAKALGELSRHRARRQIRVKADE